MKKWLGIFSWFRKPETATEVASPVEVPRAQTLVTPAEAVLGARAMVESFEKAAAYLNVRIHAADYLKKVQAEEFVYRTDLEGTITVLVLDLPYSVENVLRADALRWGIPVESLFSYALENLRDNYQREAVRYEGLADQGIYSLSGQDSFLTSAVLMPELLKSTYGRYGSIVCMPDRGTLLIRPVAGDITLEVALQVLIPFTNERFEEAADVEKVSAELYWWYEGKLLHIPYNIGAVRLNYVLPTQLEDLIY